MHREIKFRAWDKHDNDMIYFDFHDIYGNEFDGSKHIPNNVMQFIGLQDKNGKDIYEGDIVKHFGEYDYLYSEVYYSKGYWSPLVEVEDGHNCIDNYWSAQWEVVGNIYENPEMLK